MKTSPAGFDELVTAVCETIKAKFPRRGDMHDHDPRAATPPVGSGGLRYGGGPYQVSTQPSQGQRPGVTQVRDGDETEVSKALAYQKECIRELQSMTIVIERRLSSVLRPTPPANETAKTDQSREDLSQVTQAILTASQEIRGVYLFLGTIIDRLDA